MKVEPFVNLKVFCVNAALLSKVPFNIKVPVPFIPPSLDEPVLAVKEELFVKVPSLSSTADAVALFINAAPDEIFKLSCVRFAPNVVVPVVTSVVPVPVTALFIVFVFFKVKVPLFVIPDVFDESIYELSRINVLPEETLATFVALTTFVF